MANPNFGAILDRQPSEIERPKAQPIGTYDWLVKGLPKFDKSAKKGTEFVEFTCQCQAANDDVDEDELNSFLTNAAGVKTPLNSKTQRLTFYITENSIYRLVDFLIHLGFEIEKEGNSFKGIGDDEGKSLRQMVNETPNRQFRANIKHTPSDDGENMYANIDRTAAIG